MCEAPLGGDRVKLRFDILCFSKRDETVSLERFGGNHSGHRDEPVAASRHDFCQRRVLELRHNARLHAYTSEPFLQIPPKVTILRRQQCWRAVEIAREAPHSKRNLSAIENI